MAFAPQPIALVRNLHRNLSALALLLDSHFHSQSRALVLSFFIVYSPLCFPHVEFATPSTQQARLRLHGG